jgi:osmotically-inducible protein OsmY
VRVTVEGGWVGLQGELDWDYQRRSVEHVIRPMVGVVGISNEIVIKNRIVPADVSARIGEALKRQAQREADRLDVRVDGDRVTLAGSVHSWYERDAAQGAAWSAPGVRTVINEIKVG